MSYMGYKSENFKYKWHGREIDCRLRDWDYRTFGISFIMILEVDGHTFTGSYNGILLSREELIEIGCKSLEKNIESYVSEETVEFFKYNQRLALKKFEKKHKVAKWLKDLSK